MLRISLIDMPFANYVLPSIALTQLKHLTESELRHDVSINVLYLKHDFANYIGTTLYSYISDSAEALYAGFGDWFFRQVAFPELPDNTEAYLRRFYWRKDAETQKLHDLAREKRRTLDVYLDGLITKYRLGDSDFVGFTSMFMQNVASFAMARRLKTRKPKITTLMGGANCEFPMGNIIAKSVDAIDFVFSGPALKSFPDFVRYHLSGAKASCDSINGVFTKRFDRQVKSEFGEETNIDTPIQLDYSDFMRKFQGYFPKNPMKPILTIETSRGCWWGQRAHCTFCGLNGALMSYRAMKPELAIQQFQSLFRYSGQAATVQVVDNILPKNYLADVLPALNTPNNMEIFYEVKADLTPSDMAVLARARVNSIQPGIESLATSTLKLMKKGTTAYQNINFLKNCVLFKIKPAWNLLIGFPGEGADVYRRYLEIIPQLHHLNPPAGVFPIRFDRFSPYHKNADSYGLKLCPMDFYFMVYPFSEAEMREFAYYFTDTNLRAKYIQEMTEWIEKLRAAVGQWHASWATSKGNPAPRLTFLESSTVVYDSRSGVEMKHDVGRLGKQILEILSNPMREDMLSSALPGEDSAAIREEFASLEAKQLIFREGERVLSLLINEQSTQSVVQHLPEQMPREATLRVL